MRNELVAFFFFFFTPFSARLITIKVIDIQTVNKFFKNGAHKVRKQKKRFIEVFKATFSNEYH